MKGLLGRRAARTRKPTAAGVGLAALGLLVTAAASPAETITRGQITVDAQDPASVRVTSRVTFRADGSAGVESLDLYLCRALSVTKAGVNGESVSVDPAEVPGTFLRRITVLLPSAIPSGETGVLELEAVVSEDAWGIRSGPDGGFLLPGSGWFPQLAPESDELPVHSTTFRLPEGLTGIAAGAGSGSGPWTTTAGARPYAVWGRYEPAAIAGFEVYRRPGRAGSPPVDRLGELAGALETGLSVEAETRRWRVIDVGRKVIAGGLDVVFWDEEALASATGPELTLLERDLGEAIAATYWSEHFRSVGEHAAWLSRSVAAYLGDISRIVLDPSTDRTPIEALVIGSRRDTFMKGIERDRSLAGLVPVSADGRHVLATRGALLAHMMAEAVPDRTRWMMALGDFRRGHAGATVDLATFREVLARSFKTHHNPLWPYFDGTELPDFRIVSHGRGSGRLSHRYRVDVENRGTISGSVEVVTLSAEGVRMRGSRVLLAPAEKKSMYFDRWSHIAKIVLDPRGTTLQSDLSDEVVELEPAEPTPPELLVPSFNFQSVSHAGKAVEGFALDLDGVSITGFDGYVAPFRTHHGPSGAVLMGRGEVTIEPPGPFAAGFQSATGQKSLTFYGVKNMWLRFPLSAWEKIEPQLGEEPTEDADELFHRRSRVYQYMFKSYFSDGPRAQIPAPGDALAIFVDESGESRGIVRRTLPNGRVEMRLWDHLKHQTIWEETH